MACSIEKSYSCSIEGILQIMSLQMKKVLPKFYSDKTIMIYIKMPFWENAPSTIITIMWFIVKIFNYVLAKS